MVDTVSHGRKRILGFEVSELESLTVVYNFGLYTEIEINTAALVAVEIIYNFAQLVGLLHVTFLSVCVSGAIIQELNLEVNHFSKLLV